MIYGVIRFQVEGIHNYPKAEGEAEFLKYPHRHIFHIEVQIEQFHDDRDIEYIQFKRWLISEVKHKVFKGDNYNLGMMSCEMIGKRIKDIIYGLYPEREIRVCVLEDGENGALIT